MSEEYGHQQFNATDLLKRNTVDQLFKSLDDACNKQEPLTKESIETSFTKRVDLIQGLLWKYTPKELRDVIKDIRKTSDEETKKIDEDKNLNPTNKLLTKQKLLYDYSVQIFKILAVVLTNSPISVEYAEMEVMGDFQELIKTIRKKEPVSIFNTEVTI